MYERGNTVPEILISGQDVVFEPILFNQLEPCISAVSQRPNERQLTGTILFYNNGVSFPNWTYTYRISPESDLNAYLACLQWLNFHAVSLPYIEYDPLSQRRYIKGVDGFGVPVRSFFRGGEVNCSMFATIFDSISFADNARVFVHLIESPNNSYQVRLFDSQKVCVYIHKSLMIIQRLPLVKHGMEDLQLGDIDSAYIVHLSSDQQRRFRQEFRNLWRYAV